MDVPTDYKLRTLGAMMPAVYGTLAGGTANGEMNADDVVDFFVMAVAAILDNDSDIRTPRDIRQCGEMVGKRTERWTKLFREMQGEAGVSWLSVMLEQAERVPN